MRESKDGQKLERPATVELLSAQLMGPERVLNLPVSVAPAAVRVDDKEKMGITKLIESTRTNFASAWIVAVFYGRAASSGYGLTVQRIDFKAGTIQLTVAVKTPRSDQKVSDVLSFPYHVVRMPLAGIVVTPETEWAVYDADGKRLAIEIDAR